jgi:hypothetical protein
VRLGETRGSEDTVRSLAGHVSKRMLERYSQIRTEVKPAAIADLAAGSAEWEGLQDVVQPTPQPPPLAPTSRNLAESRTRPERFELPTC